MYNNPLYLNRTSLEFAYWPIDGEIVFHQGELLQGLVKAINADGMVSLALKGRLIEAAAQVPVAVGQTLLMLVDQVQEGRVRLKVVTPVELQQTEDQAIAERLMEVGIPPKASHVNMARQLLANHLLPNRPNMEAMIKYTALLGEDTPQNTSLAAVALARSLPSEAAVLQSLARYSSPGPGISTLLEDVWRAISDLYPPGEPGRQAQPSQSPAASLAKPGPGPYPLEDNPGIPLNNLPAATDTAKNAVFPANIPAARPFGGVFLKQLIDLVGQELGAYRLNPGEPSPALPSRLEQLLRSPADLLRGLLMLEEAFKNTAGLVSERSATVIMGKLESLSREMMGQQVMNLSAASSAEAPQYYFSFPVQWGAQSRPCEVRISAEVGNHGLKEKEQIDVAVSLDTPRLGTVLFHVTWHKAMKIELRGVVDSQAGYTNLQPHLHELSQALRDLGYAVKDYGLKVVLPGEGEGGLKVLPRADLKHSPGGRFKVDIKV